MSIDRRWCRHGVHTGEARCYETRLCSYDDGDDDDHHDDDDDDDDSRGGTLNGIQTGRTDDSFVVLFQYNYIHICMY